MIATVYRSPSGLVGETGAAVTMLREPQVMRKCWNCETTIGRQRVRRYRRTASGYTQIAMQAWGISTAVRGARGRRVFCPHCINLEAILNLTRVARGPAYEWTASDRMQARIRLREAYWTEVRIDGLDEHLVGALNILVNHVNHMDPVPLPRKLVCTVEPTSRSLGRGLQEFIGAVNAGVRPIIPLPV